MIVVLASAKGSPGVTTTVVALAGTWPRPVLVIEADPAGGDLAARFGLSPNPGLVSLASAARHRLAPENLWPHVQRLPGGLSALLGVQLPEQALALGPLWSRLTPVLARLGVDVLVDAGRLSAESPVLEIAAGADVVALVALPTVEGVTHLVGRLGRLEQRGLRPAVVLIGDQPYGPRAVDETLHVEGLQAAVIGVVAEDPRAAGALGGAAVRQSALERSLLVRSARVLAQQLSSQGKQPRTRLRVASAGSAPMDEDGGHGRRR